MSDAPTDPASLTHAEARERAALLEVERYDLEVDLRGLLEGDAWVATSTVTFRSRRPGASTFVDCVAEISSATLNGVALDPASASAGRLPLPDLQADNTLVVTSVQRDTGSGEAVLRTVDAQDDLVYVWSTFEPDGARRAWACFDQPDLKAVHAITALAPAAWTALSNSAPDEVADVAEADGGGRRWVFAPTPRLSTYVAVLNAGPFFEVREQRGEHSLGLWCRQSLRANLERDAEELLRVTEQGLAFYAERFAAPFAQERYDQVFVPNFGGAMENWGCVTWSDSFLHRSTPTYLERSTTATVLLHEMAHMWFGDLVTMRWWDDLWLNEAFATFASHWAQVSSTEYADAWATFTAGEQVTAYAQDASPATHPIHGEVPDVAHAFASFDAITYTKGCATLRQLMALCGEDAFARGLQAYFRDHAWGNAELDDLMTALGTAADRDLAGWRADWLGRAGTDTLSLELAASGPVLSAAGPDGAEPREHALVVGAWRRAGDGLEPVAEAEVTTTGRSTPVALPGTETVDLTLVNQGDWTFASVRPDEGSLPVLLSHAAALPAPGDRALAVTTAWDMLRHGELASGDVLDCALAVLATESSPGVFAPVAELALAAAERWSPTVLAPRRTARVAEVVATRVDHPEHRDAALRVLAWAASTPEQFATLEAAAADDVDLAWRVLVRQASLGRYDEAAVEVLLARDPDPEARLRAWGVAAAQPTTEAKDAAWDHVFRERALPAGAPLRLFSRCFWRPAQHDLLLPYAERWLDEVAQLSGGGLLALGSLTRLFAPPTCAEGWPDRALAAAERPGMHPAVARQLRVLADDNARVLAARA